MSLYLSLSALSLSGTTSDSRLLTTGLRKAGIQFFLGIYCCIWGGKIGLYHRFVVPIWLVVLVGIWAAPLYYLAVALDASLTLKTLFPAVTGSQSSSDRLTWSAVGVSCAAVNWYVEYGDEGIPSSLIYLGSEGLVESEPEELTGASTPPNHSILNMVLLIIFFVVGARSRSAVNFAAISAPMSFQAPGQFMEQTPPAAAAAKPTPTVTTNSASAPHYYFDRQNRIEVLRRIGLLQQPDGHWDWSPELQELVRQWGGGEMVDAYPNTVTRATVACILNIAEYVWAAQREGREQTALSVPEMMSLQGMNWNLGWAQMGADRATMWLSNYK